MKLIYTLLLFVLTAFSGLAQTIYYDSSWNVIPSKTGAHYYREIENRQDTFAVTDYYISGRPQMTGTYLDQQCSIQHGKFVYYHPNGQKSSEGFYDHNNQLSGWQFWNEDGSEFVETMPEYYGGIDALFQFIQKEIKYPKDARKKGIEGRVVLTFVVDTKGEITQIVIVESVFSSIDAEAVRVVSKMPKWKPGTQNGKPVFVKYTLPILFKLN